MQQTMQSCTCSEKTTYVHCNNNVLQRQLQNCLTIGRTLATDVYYRLRAMPATISWYVVSGFADKASPGNAPPRGEAGARGEREREPTSMNDAVYSADDDRPMILDELRP